MLKCTIIFLTLLSLEPYPLTSGTRPWHEVNVGPPLVRLVNFYAVLNYIPPVVGRRIAFIESKWQPRAVSHKGAVGLVQVMVVTAQRNGLKATGEMAIRLLKIPRIGVKYGFREYRRLVEKWGEDLAPYAYNAGEGVLRYGRFVLGKEK